MGAAVGFNMIATERHFLAHQTYSSLIQCCEAIVMLIHCHAKYYHEVPLCTWLHGTEALEHLYGIARQILPDFTVLDFKQMMPKIMRMVKIWINGGVKGFETQSHYGGNMGYSFDYFKAPEDFSQGFPNADGMKEAVLAGREDANVLLKIVGMQAAPAGSLSKNILNPVSPVTMSEEMVDEDEDNSEDNPPAHDNHVCDSTAQYIAATMISQTVVDNDEQGEDEQDYEEEFSIVEVEDSKQDILEKMFDATDIITFRTLSERKNEAGKRTTRKSTTTSTRPTGPFNPNEASKTLAEVLRDNHLVVESTGTRAARKFRWTGSVGKFRTFETANISPASPIKRGSICLIAFRVSKDLWVPQIGVVHELKQRISKKLCDKRSFG